MSFVKINFQSIVLYPVKYKTSMSKISKNLGPRPPNIRKNIHINFINKWCKNVKRKKEKKKNRKMGLFMFQRENYKKGPYGKGLTSVQSFRHLIASGNSSQLPMSQKSHPKYI